MSNTLNLTAADVQRLMTDASASVRAETAAKVAHAFQDQALTRGERDIAEQIFRVMLRDAETRVRQALSQNLKDNPEVPHDVARTLAGDVVEVAAPMLEFSSVLTEADLIEIVRSHSTEHQLAIAGRSDVTEPLSEALTDGGDVNVVAALLKNDRAEVSEAALQTAIDRFGKDARVNAPMVMRAKLPISVAERLVVLVSESLREHLVTHHELPADLATDLLLDSRERATVGLSTGAGHGDVAKLIRQLRRNGRLTPTLMLRALCTGDLDFFESAMAELASIPVVNAHLLVNDPGKLGLKTLYDHCHLPDGMFPVVRAAVDVAQEMRYDGQPDDRQRFVERTIERVLTQFERGIEADSLDYLIAKLGRAEPKVVPFAASKH